MSYDQLFPIGFQPQCNVQSPLLSQASYKSRIKRWIEKIIQRKKKKIRARKLYAGVVGLFDAIVAIHVSKLRSFDYIKMGKEVVCYAYPRGNSILDMSTRSAEIQKKNKHKKRILVLFTVQWLFIVFFFKEIFQSRHSCCWKMARLARQLQNYFRASEKKKNDYFSFFGGGPIQINCSDDKRVSCS